MLACMPYSIGTPNKTTSDQVGANCGNGGFICPRFMLFSAEMKQAAADDEQSNGWPAGSLNYGVATLNGAALCSCWQLVYSTPTNSAVTGVSAPKSLVVQNFNTGGANNAFDVFMGKGGEGANTNGCPQMYTTFPSTGEPYGGGIQATKMSGCGTTEAQLASSACVTAVDNACTAIVGKTSYLTNTTVNSCIEANSADSLYHENWNVKARQVECPLALTEVTGCRPNAGSLPKVDPSIQTASQASSWNSYSTTTMQDCCKPSAAWSANVSNTQSGWNAMYTCDASGNPLHN